MAKLPALISALSQHDERDRSTLEHVARTIREEGYIPTTKRGAGASGMTTEAAANLFLALNGCDAPKDASRAIERFRSLRLRERTLHESHHDVLRKIAGAENFGIALEYLIGGTSLLTEWLCGFVDADAEEWLRPRYRQSLLNLDWSALPFRFEIVLQRHPYGGRIVVQSLKPVPTDEQGPIQIVETVYWRSESGRAVSRWRTQFNAEFMCDYNLLEEGFYGRSKSRLISITIPARVLWDVARTLNGTAGLGGSE